MRNFGLLFIFLLSFVYGIEVRILNLVPYSHIKIDNKKIDVYNKSNMVLDLKEGKHQFEITHPDFLPLSFEYTVENDKPNIIILNSKDSKYKLTKKRYFYKTIKVKYKVRRGFNLVKRTDFCSDSKCEVRVKQDFVGFYNKKIPYYKKSNLYKISNKDDGKYLKAYASSKYNDFYSTSTTTDSFKDEQIILSPVSNWSMLTITQGLGIYNKLNNYKGLVIDATYRKNLPINLFFSLKSRYLEFFDTDTNKTLNGFEVGGGIGHLFSNGLMIEAGVLKNYLHAYNVDDKDIVPYGEISYKHLQLHYSPTTAELGYTNLAPFDFTYIFRFGIGGGNNKETYENSNNGGFLLGLKVKSKGFIYSSFQFNSLYFYKGENSAADTDSLYGMSYGVGLGIQLGALFAEGGVLRDKLTYKYKDSWDYIKKDIDETNLYYEIGVSVTLKDVYTGISWLHDRYYDALIISFGF